MYNDKKTRGLSHYRYQDTYIVSIIFEQISLSDLGIWESWHLLKNWNIIRYRWILNYVSSIFFENFHHEAQSKSYNLRLKNLCVLFNKKPHGQFSRYSSALVVTLSISCEILTDVTTSRTDTRALNETKSKIWSIWQTKNQGDVHVHEEHDKLVTRFKTRFGKKILNHQINESWWRKHYENNSNDELFTWDKTVNSTLSNMRV